MRRPRLLDGDVDDYRSVQKGDHVLVTTLYYQFWVHIADILQPEKIIGIICSRLSKQSHYQFGDVIQFSQRHILAAFTESANQTDANTQRIHLA